MPTMQTGTPHPAITAGKNDSLALCNKDLAPTQQQTWTWYNIFSFWMSDVHSLGDTWWPLAYFPWD